MNGYTHDYLSGRDRDTIPTATPAQILMHPMVPTEYPTLLGCVDWYNPVDREQLSLDDHEKSCLDRLRKRFPALEINASTYLGKLTGWNWTRKDGSDNAWSGVCSMGSGISDPDEVSRLILAGQYGMRVLRAGA